MKHLYATAIVIAVIGMFLCCSIAIAFDFGVYPGRFHCTGGYDYTVHLELQDNTTENLTVNLSLQSPSHPDDGYTAMPNMSWVSFSPNDIVHNTTVTIQGKPEGQTRYQITQVPVYIDIPDNSKYNGRQWEIDALSTFPKTDDGDGGVSFQQRARQRILIETPPETQTMSLLPLGILLLSLAVAFTGYGIYLKKRNING